MNYEDYNRLVVSDIQGALHAAGLNADEYNCFVERDAFNRDCSSIVIRREFQKIGNRWPIKFGLDQEARQRRAKHVANEAVWELWNDNDRHRFARRQAERLTTTDAPGALPKKVLDAAHAPVGVPQIVRPGVITGGVARVNFEPDGADLEMTNQPVALPDIDPGSIRFHALGYKVEAGSDHGLQIAPQYQFSVEPQHGFAYRPVRIENSRTVEGRDADEALAAMRELAAMCKVKNDQLWCGRTTAKLVKAWEEFCDVAGERMQEKKRADDAEEEIERLRDELAAAHERDSQNAAHISRLCRQLADIERRVAGGEAGPSAVAQAPGYERGPRIVAQSQYDPDE